MNKPRKYTDVTLLIIHTYIPLKCSLKKVQKHRNYWAFFVVIVSFWKKLVILHFQGIFFPFYCFEDNEGVWDHHYLSAGYVQICWFLLIATNLSSSVKVAKILKGMRGYLPWVCDNNAYLCTREILRKLSIWHFFSFHRSESK